MLFRLFFCTLTSTLILAAATTVYSATVNPTDRIQLTDLGVGVKPVAINNNGVVVGQNSNGQAFRWSAGTLTNLGTLGGATSFANAVNDAGTVVGWSIDGAGKQKSFMWDGSLINLDSSVNLQGSAQSINNNGDIVGWRTNGTVFKSYLWDESNPDGFLLFRGDSGSLKALGINDSNEVVGVSLDNGIGGFYWNGSDDSNNYSHGLDTAYVPYAGINNLSVTAGVQNNTAKYMPAEDVGTSYIGSVTPSDTTSNALGLNDLGVVVGESSGKGFFFEINTGMIYNSNDFELISQDFETIVRLTDINDDGTFVGVALVGGVEHGIVGQFVPVPEPSSVVLAAIGLIAAGWIARRRAHP